MPQNPHARVPLFAFPPCLGILMAPTLLLPFVLLSGPAAASPLPSINYIDQVPLDTYRSILQLIPDPNLGSCLSLNRRNHDPLIKDRNLRNRARPCSVRVQIGDAKQWLDPDEEYGWDLLPDIAGSLIVVRPQSLIKSRRGEGREMRKTLLDRLPTPDWREQAISAAAQGTEPAYLKSISQILTATLPSMAPFAQAALNNDVRKLHAAQVLLSMYGYLYAAGNAAWGAALDRARPVGDSTQYYAARTARYSGGIAARDAARRAALGVAGSDALDAALRAGEIASKNAAEIAARVAAEDAIRQLRQYSPGDHPPTPLLVGNIAYRVAELAAHLAVLERGEAVVKRVFTDTATYLSARQDFSMFATQSAWEAFKRKHFGVLPQDEDHRHFLQPWLQMIDQLVQEIVRDPEEAENQPMRIG